MPSETILTTVVEFTFSANVNGKPAFTTGKPSAQQLDSGSGMTFTASTYDYVNKQAVGGSTSPIKGKNLYLWCKPEDYSDSVGKKFTKKFANGMFCNCEINAKTGAILSWGEFMTDSEFAKSKLTAEKPQSIAMVAV